MKYLSVKEIATLWNTSERSVRNYCAAGRVPGAFLTGKTWTIPEIAEKPERSNKSKHALQTLADILKEEIGWNMNTTYTVIKKCIAKGAIERSEPNFMCHALIAKEVVQEAEAEELIGKLFDGSPDKLFAALLDNQKLSREQIENLRRMVAELE